MVTVLHQVSPYREYFVVWFDIYNDTENWKSPWCQICRHRWQLWQPAVLPVTTKLTPWQLSVFLRLALYWPMKTSVLVRVSPGVQAVEGRWSQSSWTAWRSNRWGLWVLEITPWGGNGNDRVQDTLTPNTVKLDLGLSKTMSWRNTVNLCVRPWFLLDTLATDDRHSVLATVWNTLPTQVNIEHDSNSQSDCPWSNVPPLDREPNITLKPNVTEKG